MPLEYPPPITASDFEDENAFVQRWGRSTERTGRSVQDCPLKKEQPPPEKLCAINELTVTAGAKTSKSYRAKEHEPIPSRDASRVNFAPKIEKATIKWKVENPDIATGARLEIYRRKQVLPLFYLALNPEELAKGEYVYDGSTDAEHLFPSKFLNVEHGPFKVKLTIEGPVKADHEKAYSYFDVLLHSISLRWGTYAELPAERPDITEANRLKILGTTAPKKKGYEEEALDAIVAKNATPGAGQQHQVLLKTNLFAKKKPGDMEVEEYVEPTDFELYKALWGNGARIPIHAKALVKKSDGSGVDTAPEALTGCRLIWNWHDSDLRKWRTGLTPTAKTEDYLRDIFSQNEFAQPKNVANCPVGLGGKLGDSSAPIFLANDGAGAMPYRVEAARTRTWAAMSQFRPEGTAAERCETGVIFHPSRIAGDRYPVRCALYFDSSQDALADSEPAAPALAEAGVFEIFKHTKVQYLVRGGAAQLGCDPAAIETTLRDVYLKECKTVVDIQRRVLDNAVLVPALRAAAQRLEKIPNAYTQFQMMPLFTRYLVNFAPAENSPAVVLKPKETFLSELDTAVRAGRWRKIAVDGMRPGEELTGQASGAKGIPLTIGDTSAKSPVPMLILAGAEFQDNERVTGGASGVTNTATVTPVRNCWNHTYAEAVSNTSAYDHAVKVTANGKSRTIVFAKSFLMRSVSTNIDGTARRALIEFLADAASGHNETQPLPITITHKGKDSENHRERMANLKKAIDELLIEGEGMLDRSAAWNSFKNKTWAVSNDKSTYRQMFQKTFAVNWLIQAIVEQCVTSNYPDEEGVFLLHVPGRTNVAELPELAEKFQDLRVAGAFYGDAFEHDRTKTATYVATLPLDTPNLYKEGSKSIESIFAHEAAHAIFLPHAPQVDPKAPPASQSKEGCHVKGDNCLMNYDLDSEHFCGVCMIRLRGWNWTPLPNSLGEQEYQIAVELDDLDTIFAGTAASDEGLKERLQVLGLLNRPLDHPDANACFGFNRDRLEELFPALEDCGVQAWRDYVEDRVREFLIEGGRLPATGTFAKLRAPGGPYAGYSQNYLMATIPEADQGELAAKPYEDFMLGANRGSMEDAFYKANPALGKIPLKVTVRRRPKFSDIPWGDCPFAPDAKVYFELVPPDDIAGAPAGDSEFVTVAGAKSYQVSVKPPDLKGTPKAYITNKVDGFKPSAGPDAKNAHKELGGKRGDSVFCKPRAGAVFEPVPFDSKFKFASVATAGPDGVARMVFAPSRIGGDSYKLRIFVGPVTQDKFASDLAKGGDDVFETGTMVRWRTIRVCRDIEMHPSLNAGEAPAESCKKADSGLMPNVEPMLQDLAQLDLTEAMTVEFAKAYCELLIEQKAEAPIGIHEFGDRILAKAKQLAAAYPKFNTTAYASLSIHKMPLPLRAESANLVFSATIPTRPEITTVTVRPKGGGPDTAIASDTDGTWKITGAGAASVDAVALSYESGEISVTFKNAQVGREFDVCFHPAAYANLDQLLIFPEKSPYLFNLKLPRVYDPARGDGFLPAGKTPLDELAKPDPFHSFVDSRTLGLAKALLMEAAVRGVEDNGGFFPGLIFFRAVALDNYSAIWPTGTQEGKGVGNGIFLFGGAQARTQELFNALSVHEMSHGLFLMHAPTAPGNKPEQHDGADQFCVMSYSANDGDHCGQCVAVLRGMKTWNAPFR